MAKESIIMLVVANIQISTLDEEYQINIFYYNKKDLSYCHTCHTDYGKFANITVDIVPVSYCGTIRFTLTFSSLVR
jgi:hypothetical protein